MPPAVEAMVLEMRRSHVYWGARRIALELARKRVEAAPSESAVYRCLVRAAVIDPISRQRRRETWKRWERGAPMELWQLDLVHGFLLADGTSAKALTDVDDHSRFCISARRMARERTQSVCDGFSSALNTYGVPAQVLTDNGKVFTGRFAQPPVEVLFDRICRENGVDHLLTAPRSPTTTGKIERFHKTLRVEFDTRQVFRNLKTAQEALDEWVTYYNTQRPHQSLADATPESRFHAGDDQPQHRLTPRPERNGEQWVSRRVASNGLVSVGYQQVSVGKHFGGSGEVAQAWVVLRDGAVANEEEIRAYCRGRLAPYKVPARVEFISALPRAAAGKVLRRMLVAGAGVGLDSGARPLAAEGNRDVE